ncbi:class I SAM-dependent methyltransferase [Flavobacterium sp. 3HN19-14]|uniref:class I SAM-dependent methyltransferase n=1 Tax=Flavobacterium sp. 3HN19-14 TaxID=3448133 RepID=UPI003EE289B4
MDDFAMKGETLRDALDKIAALNKFLGGNKLTLNGVKKLIAEIPLQKKVTIIDVGCGNGDMLRYLADYARENKVNCQFIGIDLNEFTIDYARKLSEIYPEISFQCLDIFSQQFIDLKYDIALCTLTLHHFKNKEIVDVMNILKANSKNGIVINDLHRSQLFLRLISNRLFLLQA